MKFAAIHHSLFKHPNIRYGKHRKDDSVRCRFIHIIQGKAFRCKLDVLPEKGLFISRLNLNRKENVVQLENSSIKLLYIENKKEIKYKKVNFILTGENKILIKTLSIFLIIVMTLPVGAFAYNGTTSNAEASTSLEKGILSLQQMGNETVMITLTLSSSIPQQELSNMVSTFNSTKFSFHGHMVPILLGKPENLKNIGYVLRLYGPADLIASKISGIGTAFSTGISIKALPNFEPNNFKAVDDLGTNPTSSVQPETINVRNLIGAGYVESSYGITGNGVKIAIVDTGVDYAHPDL
ncbi:MAG: hypothetical protein C0179_00515, partial [Fervidicoccus sp.]